MIYSNRKESKPPESDENSKSFFHFIFIFRACIARIGTSINPTDFGREGHLMVLSVGLKDEECWGMTDRDRKIVPDVGSIMMRKCPASGAGHFCSGLERYGA